MKVIQRHSHCLSLALRGNHAPTSKNVILIFIHLIYEVPHFHASYFLIRQNLIRKQQMIKFILFVVKIAFTDYFDDQKVLKHSHNAQGRVK